MSPLRVALVTNVPAPYRLPALQRVARRGDIELHAVYCSAPHIDDTLGAQAHGFATHWLGGTYRAMERRFLHNDLGVTRVLRRIQPEVVVTTGYIPTFLFAYLWARRAGVPHVVMTDGTVASESGLTPIHRWVRRRVWGGSQAFAGACEGSLDLFRKAGIGEQRLFKVPLAVDNSRFASASMPAADRSDFLYCGRLVEHKRPRFAIDVAAAVARRIGRRTSIDIVGAGPQELQLREHATALNSEVDVRFHGYLPQSELATRYAASRLFLFPSEWDPWGVVANEACASGLPVLVSPHAGAAHELVLDGVNGRVLPLQVERWGTEAAELLGDEALCNRMGTKGREAVQAYTFEAAAEGLAGALWCAAKGRAAPVSGLPP